MCNFLHCLTTLFQPQTSHLMVWTSTMIWKNSCRLHLLIINVDPLVQLMPREPRIVKPRNSQCSDSVCRTAGSKSRQISWRLQAKIACELQYVHYTVARFYSGTATATVCIWVKLSVLPQSKDVDCRFFKAEC